MRLDVEQNEMGVWAVTSPDHKGLLAVGKDLSLVLASVPRLLDDLRRAGKRGLDDGPIGGWV
jgi:hypothetical protein